MKAENLARMILTIPRWADGSQHVLETHSVGEVLGSQTDSESQLRRSGNPVAEIEIETWTSV
jgi:hypothetical protein